jgi:ubiquinone/menaquinone biosynthesis C-methylase UbiE
MVEVLTWLLTALGWSAAILLAVIVWRRLFAAPMPPIFNATLDTGFRRRHFSPDVAAERHGLRPGMRVLELGPAGGYLTSAAQRRIQPGGRLVCLDLQPSLLRKLRGRLGAETPPLVCGNAQQLPFRDDCFDLVFVVEVMGEIPDKGVALREIRRVLHPGGTLAVSEAALLDPDYVRFPVLMRLAAVAGFSPREGFSQWFQYTQRFVSPTAQGLTRDAQGVRPPPQDLR